MQSTRSSEKTIGIFGSASTDPGSPDYLDALALGAMLAEAPSGGGRRPGQRAVPAPGWRRARPRSLRSGWHRPGR